MKHFGAAGCVVAVAVLLFVAGDVVAGCVVVSVIRGVAASLKIGAF